MKASPCADCQKQLGPALDTVDSHIVKGDQKDGIRWVRFSDLLREEIHNDLSNVLDAFILVGCSHLSNDFSRGLVAMDRTSTWYNALRHKEFSPHRFLVAVRVGHLDIELVALKTAHRYVPIDRPVIFKRLNFDTQTWNLEVHGETADWQQFLLKPLASAAPHEQVTTGQFFDLPINLLGELEGTVFHGLRSRLTFELSGSRRQDAPGPE